MENWRRDVLHLLLQRQNSTMGGMNMVKSGIEVPATEMSHDDWLHIVNMLNQLPLSQVLTIRYVFMGFGCWSIALAFMVIVRIWYDSWRAQQLRDGQHSRWQWVYDLHPAESFPLMLGWVILAQSLSFVVVQSMALSSAYVIMCKVSATIVFTQIFAIGWFHIVFGVDMTVRALKPPTLTVARRRTRITMGFILIALLLSLATWLASRIQPAADKCFGDLIFRTMKSALLGIVFCAIMIPSFLIMASIIGYRLRKTVLMDHNERIAGTRMVYYLVEAAVLYIMILPFWIQAMTGDFDANFGSLRVAEFMLFGWGSVICITHFILRANAARMAIKASRTPWMKQRKFRLFGPSDLEIINISPPIINKTTEFEPDDKYGRSLTSPTDSSRNGSEVGSSVSSSPPKPIFKNNWPLLDDMERPPTPAKPPTAKTKHKKQPSYSLFPGEDDLRLPATVYIADRKSSVAKDMADGSAAFPSLLPPIRPFVDADGLRESTATLQIGMRFSSAPAAAAAESRPTTPISQPQRPSLLTAIDDMIRDTNDLQYSASPAARQNEQPNNEYDWLDLPKASSDVGIGTSTPVQTPVRRASSLFLSRSESLRQQAKNNRLELTNLERSGSGAGKARLRPAYPNPRTPD